MPAFRSVQLLGILRILVILEPFGTLNQFSNFVRVCDCVVSFYTINCVTQIFNGGDQGR